MSALTFTVAVDYTDRQREGGRFRTYRTHVDVLADTDAEAVIVAAQMVAAIRDDTIDGMVVASRITACIA